MTTDKTNIGIWHNGLGYCYSDDYDAKSQLSMDEAFGMLMARLMATLRDFETANGTAEYHIEIVGRVYSD